MIPKPLAAGKRMASENIVRTKSCALPKRDFRLKVTKEWGIIDSTYSIKRKEISMPTLERVVKPRRNRISLEIPKRFGKYTFRIVMIPIVEDEKPKYDFSDLVGRLEWNGDAVKEQRRLRDEW